MFSLIRHKRAEKYSWEYNWYLWRKKWILSNWDLDLWPTVKNFNRVWASAVSNHIVKTASKPMHPFSWNFVHKQSWTDTQTDRHQYTSTTEVLPGIEPWTSLSKDHHSVILFPLYFRKTEMVCLKEIYAVWICSSRKLKVTLMCMCNTRNSIFFWSIFGRIDRPSCMHSQWQ